MPGQRKSELFTRFHLPGLQPEGTLEELGLAREEVTIASVGEINMYLSIKIATIRKAVRYFTRKLTRETKKTINLSLDLIYFGMSSTLISFDGEHYEYHGGEKEEK